MIKKLIYLNLITCLVISTTGCASIMNGTTQSIGISSVPTGSIVSVNNSEKGKTPIIVELKRKDQHIVKIELPGYEIYETTLTRSTSGWVWGNLAFGGLVGLAIDAISGGLYKLTPDQIEATLSRNGQNAINQNQEDMLIIATVLVPDEDWVKIGQLKIK